MSGGPASGSTDARRPLPDAAGPGAACGVRAASAAVVVLNYGSQDLIDRNLGGTLDHPDAMATGLRVVVVDNYLSAADRSATAALCRRHGWDFVALPDNRGFGVGINAGLRHAIDLGCTAFVILNPDLAISPGSIVSLAREIDRTPLALVSPRIVTTGAGREFIGSRVGLASGRIRGIRDDRPVADRPARTILSRPSATGTPSDERSAVWLSGACMAFGSELLARVGFFAEDFFMYWEDVDFSVRCGRAGATLVVRHDLEAFHDEEGTQAHHRGRAKSSTYYYYNCRNRLLFAGRQLDRSDLLRWVWRTPAESWAILLRGGRRQLVQSARPALAVTRGSLAGVAAAGAAVVGSLVTADRTHPGATTGRPAPIDRDRDPASHPASDTDPLMVTIAVLTFRRPTEVAETVRIVLDQVEDVLAGSGGHRRFEVVIIDNDPAGSAAGTAEEFGDRIRYVHEVEPGISAGRNRAIDEAVDSDVLVFVDDDERPQQGWLSNLLATRDRTGATAVAGAVVSDFSGRLDDWIAAGGFFDRRRLRTGTEIGTAATNNLLLDLRQTRPMGVRFRSEFGLSGGEDTMFTRTIHQRGGTLVWCDEAVVVDMVPADRMTRSWVLARALQSGNSWSRVGVAMSGTPAEKLVHRFAYAASGIPRIATGVSRLAYGVATRSPRHQARGLRTMARGAGMTAGAFGWLRHSYTRSDEPAGSGPGAESPARVAA